MNNNILVSICVITYNSSSTVFETLESIKEQTYKNIELIISDDGSTDNTLEVCQEWLTKNKQRFNRIELITIEKNTGTPSNCNRAVKAAKGEWIKLIAGDDCLAPNGIEDFVNDYNGDDLLVICNYKTFTVDNKGNKNFFTVPNTLVKKVTSKPVNKQFNELILRNYINAPSVIIKRILFDKIGYFDESYKLLEDLPFWIKATLNGYKFSYLPIFLVYYRISGNSVTSQTKKMINEGLYSDNIHLYKNVMHKYSSYLNIIYWGTYFNFVFTHYIIVEILNNHTNRFNKMIYRILYNLSPVIIYRKILNLI